MERGMKKGELEALRHEERVREREEGKGGRQMNVRGKGKEE